MKIKKTEEAEQKTYLSIGFLRKLDKVDPFVKDLIISFANEIQSIMNTDKNNPDELKNVIRKPTEAQKKKKRKVRQNEKNISI